ncbi:MAG: hypothetical protein OEY99_02160, partial [Aigarchaeota archaeon]|nr:hypothetical protein [Aigarchaeota archaeon]
DELHVLKALVGLGGQVQLEWRPGAIEFKNGKQLQEEVRGDTVIIYAEDPEQAKELLIHGFLEWVLNEHTKGYRLLVNKLIEVFEEIHYQSKEKLLGAFTRVLQGGEET